MNSRVSVRRSSAFRALGVLLFAFPAAAHAATYSHAPTVYNWVDPSLQTAVVWSNPSVCSGFSDTIGDDSITAPINIGFTFTVRLDCLLRSSRS